MSRIASTVGNPLYVDECTAKQIRVSYARVVVEVDVTQEIPEDVLIEDSSGRSFNQAIQFDWKPEYCKRCLKLGHNCEHAQAQHTEGFDNRNGNRRRHRRVNQRWVPHVNPGGVS